MSLLRALLLLASVSAAAGLTITQQATVLWVAGAFSPSVSILATNTTAVINNGIAGALITATLRDANANPISLGVVALSSSRGPADIISAASGASSNGGVVTFIVSSSAAGVAVFNATDVSAGSTIVQTVSVTFTQVSAALSMVVATPSTVAADGLTPCTVVVTLFDSNATVVSGKNVTLLSNRGLSDSISGSPGTTNASGMVVFTVVSIVAGTTDLITADDITDAVLVTQTASITWTAGNVSASISNVTITPASQTADSVSIATATVYLLDQYTNAVPSKAAALVSNRGVQDTLTYQGQISPGVFVWTITTTKAGSSLFSATDTTDVLAITGTASVTWVAGLVSASVSTVQTLSATQTANGVSTTVIVVTLLDAYSNPVAGQTPIGLNSSRGAVDTIVGPSPSASNASGMVTFTATTTVIGSSVYTAFDTDPVL